MEDPPGVLRSCDLVPADPFRDRPSAQLDWQVSSDQASVDVAKNVYSGAETGDLPTGVTVGPTAARSIAGHPLSGRTPVSPKKLGSESPLGLGQLHVGHHGIRIHPALVGPVNGSSS